MSITVHPYSAADAKRWDAFVQTSRNGTIFHTRRFLSYHEADKFQDASLLFIEGDKIVAVLPAAQMSEEGKRILVSHPGASYGGLVLSDTEGMTTTGAVVQALREHATHEKFNEVRLLRLTPASLRHQSSDDLEYWLFSLGFRVWRAELATTVFLTGLTEESLLEQYTAKCRNKVRQAQKFAGLTVSLDKDFAAFWPLLERTLQERHTAKPTHSLEQIERLRTLCPEVRLISARQNGDMIAGIVSIAVHPGALYTLYVAQDYTLQHLHPLNLLVSELAKICLREGRVVLHLGISTEDGGKIVNEGLFSFKESFGGVSVRRDSWTLTLHS